MSCGPITEHSKLTFRNVHSIAHWQVSTRTHLDSVAAAATENDLHKIAYVTDIRQYFGLVGVFPTQWELLGGDNVVNFAYIPHLHQIKLATASGNEFVISLAPLVEELQAEFDDKLDNLNLVIQQFVNQVLNDMDLQGLADAAANAAIAAHNQDETAHPALETNAKELHPLVNGETINSTKLRYYADSEKGVDPVRVINLPVTDELHPDYDPEIEVLRGATYEILVVGNDDAPVQFVSKEAGATIINSSLEIPAGTIARVTATLLNDGNEVIPDVPAEISVGIAWLINVETSLGSGSGLEIFEGRQLELDIGFYENSLTAISDYDNVHISLVPKGMGGFYLGQSGFRRGHRSVDLQIQRTKPSEVCSGSYSTIAGGQNNTNESNSSFLGGGSNNTIKDYSQYAVLVGGSDNIVDGHLAVIVGGLHGHTRGLQARQSFASRKRVDVGDSQIGLQVLGGDTFNSTPINLTADRNPLEVDEDALGIVSVLPDNFTYLVTAQIVAREVNSGLSKVWQITGAVRRGVGESSIEVIGSPTKVIVAEDAGTESWECDLTVSTFRGSAEIVVIGGETQEISWVCKFDTVEVG